MTSWNVLGTQFTPRHAPMSEEPWFPNKDSKNFPQQHLDMSQIEDRPLLGAPPNTHS